MLRKLQWMYFQKVNYMLLLVLKVDLMNLPGEPKSGAEWKPKTNSTADRHKGQSQAQAKRKKITDQEMNLPSSSWLEWTTAMEAVITSWPTWAGRKRAVRSAFSWLAQWGQVLFMPWLVHIDPSIRTNFVVCECLQSEIQISEKLVRLLSSNFLFPSFASPPAFSLAARPASSLFVEGQPETFCKETLLESDSWELENGWGRHQYIPVSDTPEG